MARAALAAKAEEPVILDLRRVSFSFEFFLICTASSGTRLQAAADTILEDLSGAGLSARHVEGRPEGGWVLMDFGAAVAHLFLPEARQFYDLERLWADAPRLPVPGTRRALSRAAEGASARRALSRPA